MKSSFIIRRQIRKAYRASTLLLWPPARFYYFLRTRAGGKYAGSFRQRLGLERPPALPGGRRIWVHALSVGETLSVVPLLWQLKEAIPDAEMVFSTATESGQETARKKLGKKIDRFFYLPHDFGWLPTIWVERVKPMVFLLVETDVWPGILWALKERGVPTVLLNGRLSPRTFTRWMRFQPVIRPVLQCFDLICAQSKRDAARYAALGVSPKQIQTLGNLKLDGQWSRLGRVEKVELARDIGLEGDRRVWIAGSTHEGEEALVLEAHRTLRSRWPDLLLILAPRQVHRAEAAASLCREMGLSAVRRSQGRPVRGKAVLLLDTLGELGRFYALAEAAFIGGSLVPFGGHNPLEAAAQGKPALWGPHMHNFRELERDLLESGLGLRVDSIRELQKVLAEWLSSPKNREGTDLEAQKFFERHAGAGRRTVRAIMATMGIVPEANRFREKLP